MQRRCRYLGNGGWRGRCDRRWAGFTMWRLRVGLECGLASTVGVTRWDDNGKPPKTTKNPSLAPLLPQKKSEHDKKSDIGSATWGIKSEGGSDTAFKFHQQPSILKPHDRQNYFDLIVHDCKINRHMIVWWLEQICRPFHTVTLTERKFEIWTRRSASTVAGIEGCRAKRGEPWNGVFDWNPYSVLDGRSKEEPKGMCTGDRMKGRQVTQRNRPNVSRENIVSAF